MAEPYIQKNPNDLIRAADWNQIQIRAREDIEQHKHTGGADGTPIGTAGLVDGAITTAKLANGAVTSAKLDPAVLAGISVGPGSIGTVQLADSAVNSSKLDRNAVRTHHVAADSITFDKLAPEVRLVLSNSADFGDLVPGPFAPPDGQPIPTPGQGPATPAGGTPTPVKPSPGETPPVVAPRPVEFAAVREATSLTLPATILGAKSVPTDVRPSAEARAAYQAPEITLHPIRPSFDHVYATWSSTLGRLKDGSRAAVIAEDRAAATGFRKALMALNRRITKLAEAAPPALAVLRTLTDHLEPEALHAGKAQAALALLGDTRLAGALAQLALPETEAHLEQALQIIDLSYENLEWAGLLLALARQCNPELLTKAGAAKTAGDVVSLVAEADPYAVSEIIGGLAVPAPDEVPALALPPTPTTPQVVMEVEATVRIAAQAICAVGIGSLEVPPPPGQLTLVQGGALARSTRKSEGAPAVSALLATQATVTLRRRIRYPAELGSARTVRLWLSAYEQPATLVDVQLRAHTLGGHDPVVEGGGLWSPAR